MSCRFMGILYVLCALTIIGMSIEHIPAALALIVSGAFSAESVTGGMVGAIIVGFQRALFSNEAGHRLGLHRPLRRADRRARLRGPGVPAGTLYRHRGDLHPELRW